MEKNQQNHSAATTQTGKINTGNQPGQQLPPKSDREQLDHPVVPEEKIHHSDSSFPQSDEETLGTP